jgi:hypothetical protein
MNLQDYIESKTTGKLKAIPADIRERWASRIMPANLQLRGEAGAQSYLRDYGKGIAAPKCIMFGRLALENGLPEFAAGFFKKAAELEGVELSDVGNPTNGTRMTMADRVLATMTPSHIETLDIPGFPTAFQPGRFAPMQPIDAARERSFYITQPGYWGQPKVDGQKLIVFATPDQVYYQSRQMKVNGMPSVEMDQELRAAAKALGNFVLEGELTFLDCEDKEHRTGAQAATVNAEKGQPEYLPEMKYCIFSCIWRDGSMLRRYGDMVDEGKRISDYIGHHFRNDNIIAVTTSKTTDEKSMLASLQEGEGREGEVWFDPNMPYIAGKHKDDRFVRTKYLTEFEAIVVGFTPTTAEGHAFGAMSIESLDGKDLGNVGTGFTREDKWELMRRFQASQHGNNLLRVEIRCQGFTEGADGKPWHARFLRIVE